MTGNCPKCGEPIAFLKKDVTYLCPVCDAILSVSINPISLKAELVAELSRSWTRLKD
jgi:uncharacterized Zn finger protein (UPF0148 family)